MLARMPLFFLFRYFGGVEFPVDGVTGRALGNDVSLLTYNHKCDTTKSVKTECSVAECSDVKCMNENNQHKLGPLQCRTWTCLAALQRAA